MTAESVTIVIGSAGRRLYLIDWFRAAFETLGLNGRIIVVENDPSSAAASYGDETRLLPRYSDPGYGDAILRLVDEVEPRLFLSANDYELMQLHVNTGIADSLRDRGVFVPGVSAAWQVGCADKLRMAQMLEGVDVPTPKTVMGSDLDSLLADAGESDEFVVKHRFGSRSSGLAVVARGEIDEAVANSAKSVPPRADRTDPRDDVIVQPRMPGSEYGVDIVSSLLDPGPLTGVFARRKLRMRAGETDKAVTVDPGPFREASGKIARSAGLSGLIDVDMFLDDQGQASVIDINPRFGGGYPFVHLAGADVPLYYTGQIFGIPVDEGWNRYEPGIVSAKYQETRVTARGSREGNDSSTSVEHT
ncbi:ATP-grasp domain-containing protein [Brevibacterium antiquum]|uniref:Carbamoyl-phosphate synthase large subunit n=1 Tax=Brevibacterium antiquum TaxID=234835 RepID=A0A2H1JMF5_9MICO|nr:ATP-grasp domain-containing protein [Brevibacterium antiquum]SMX88498.1 carbamoyl-phosphate synthase large subunit [Brevibacterium antiquum]